MTGDDRYDRVLRKGVPEHLRNAALRKSWALDPAIRNYVNPALDYAYDWNTPGGVPGSGELDAGTDVARMVLQIMGGGAPAETKSISVGEFPNQEPAGDPRTNSRISTSPASEPRDLPTEAVRRTDTVIPSDKC